MATLRRSVALLLCAALTAPACATARATSTRFPQSRNSAAQTDPALMAEYVRQLPIGSRVRVDLADGTRIHATLMKATPESIVVQKRTRLPEAPIEIAIRDLRAVELETSGSTARTVGIAVAAGVAATFGVLLLLAAIFSD